MTSATPALDVARQLAEAGAHVTVTDPAAINNAWLRYPQLRFEASTERALEGAELVLLLTEWDAYRELSPAAAGDLVRRRTVLDARNALDAAAWAAAGWTVRGLGRPEAAGHAAGRAAAAPGNSPPPPTESRAVASGRAGAPMISEGRIHHAASLVSDSSGRGRVSTSARTEEDARLREAMSLLSATLESTADGILVVSAEGRITSVNNKFLSMWGIPRELVDAGDDDAVIGSVLGQLVDPEKFVAKVSALYADPDAESNDVLHFRDGTHL